MDLPFGLWTSGSFQLLLSLQLQQPGLLHLQALQPQTGQLLLIWGHLDQGAACGSFCEGPQEPGQRARRRRECFLCPSAPLSDAGFPAAAALTPTSSKGPPR